VKWTCLFGHDWWYHWSDTLREKVKVCEKCGKVDRFIHKHVAARERRVQLKYRRWWISWRRPE